MNTATAGLSLHQQPRVNGRIVVLGMFAFGVVMTSALGLYWEFYTRPFRALQTAIDHEYPGCTPRVIGGRHKSHKTDNPSVLRVIVNVEFDPTVPDSAEAAAMVTHLGELAQHHVDLSDYETLDVHLLQRVPEQENRQQSFSRSVADL